MKEYKWSEYRSLMRNAFVDGYGRHYCKNCAVCDGKACKGKVPGMGGVSQGRTFYNNVHAWDAYGIGMTSLKKGKGEVDTRFNFFGMELSMPIMVAPLGGIPLNISLDTKEDKYCEYVCQGANLVGTIAFTGDSGAEGVSEAGLKQLKPTQGFMVPTIKPRETKEIIAFANRAIERGARVLACDIDAAVLVNMRNFGQPVETKTVEEWIEVVQAIRVPLILKGVMDGNTAVALAKGGVKALVVSNHGGRIIDGMLPTAEVLPGIHHALVEAGVRDQVMLLVDGGIRSGEDVYKALALGAEAALVGRPIGTTACGAGSPREAVEMLLGLYRQGLRDAMYMNGQETLSDITSESIVRFK